VVGRGEGDPAEIAAIAKAKGIVLPADAAEQAFEKGKAFGPDTKTSYQRDVEVRGKPNEGDSSEAPSSGWART
jgi:hypothetical protein